MHQKENKYYVYKADDRHIDNEKERYVDPSNGLGKSCKELKKSGICMSQKRQREDSNLRPSG
ncbi:putative integrase [Sulfuracidifex tepidarius]|uniref:putative integrase n=1 Tax=Sulfuracidifex tepidarius TaxID=1294262 RepID=UPI0011F32C17